MLERNSISRRTLAEIFQHLATLSEAGLPLVSALDTLIHTSFPTQTRAILQDIKHLLQSGYPLSEALKKHQTAFSPLICQITTVGEKVGNLAPYFREIEYHVKWQEVIYSRLKKTFRYGLAMLTLVVLMIATTIFLLLPQVEHLLIGLGIDSLPLSTRLLIACAHVFSYPALIPSGIMMLGMFLFFSFKPHHILRIPFYGTLLTSEIALHYLKSLSTLLKAHLDLLIAHNDAQEAVPYIFIQKRLSRIPSLLAQGKPFSEALEEQKLFSPLALRLIRLGENTGRLSEMVEQAATWYQQTYTLQVETFVSKIHPLFISILGILIVWIVLAVLTPLYQNMGTLS